MQDSTCNIKKLDQLEKFINNIPILIYYKNNFGIYAWCNNTSINSFNFVSNKDVIGKNDFELWKTNDTRLVNKVVNHDLSVIEEGQPIIVKERTILNGIDKSLLSYKFPNKNLNGKNIGIFGISIEAQQFEEQFDFIKFLEKCIISASKYVNTYSYLSTTEIINRKSIVKHKTQKAVALLPIRLQNCLIKVLQGKTAKQIAKELSLSTRTIEHYSSEIKDLLDCASIKELISSYAFLLGSSELDPISETVTHRF